jgi:hypothetical protein
VDVGAAIEGIRMNTRTTAGFVADSLRTAGLDVTTGVGKTVADGLFDRCQKPDVVRGQHVMVGPAGDIGTLAARGA